MKKKFLNFLTKLLLLTLLAGLLAFILNYLFPQRVITGVFPYMLALFFVVTAIVHYVLLRITTLKPAKFVSYFMLATFLKLMNYMIVVVVYVLIVKQGILSFVINFFVLYIIYTIFEVVSILSQTKE